MFSLKIEVAEVLGEPVHVLADFIVGDSCVDLRCLHVGVAEHLAHSLDGHSLAERHGRGEGMACEMKSEVLLDAADFGYLFQIAVHLLVGDDGEYLAVNELALIFLQDFKRRRQQGHSHLGVGFLAVGDYPQATVEHLLDVIDTEVGEVDICQPGEAGEDEDVAHLFQTLGGELLLHHLAKLVFGEIATVNTLDGDFVTVERVNGYQPGADGFVDYLLEELHALVGGVLRVFVLGTEEELKIHDELVSDFTERYVRDVVFLLHELHHAAVHPFVLAVGGVGLAESDEFLGVFEVLLVEFEKRFLTLGYPHVGVAHHFSGDVAVTTLDIVVVVCKDGLGILKVVVQLKYFGRTPQCSS